MNQSELNYSGPPFYRPRLGFYADIHKLEYLLFQIDPNFREFRKLKEKYIYFNNSCGNNPNKARPLLRQLIHEYRSSGFKLFRDIERMCADETHRSRLSNGPMESLNRIVKDMRRNGRGFRNFGEPPENFDYPRKRENQIFMSDSLVFRFFSDGFQVTIICHTYRYY